MPGDPDAAERADDDPAETPETDRDRSVFDRRLLSDLSINAVPVVIIAAFVLGFVVLSSGAESDPLVLFHGALIGGIVLVSAVAAWVIGREDAPLEGSAADAGGDPDDD